jgi:hypothetical protein
VRAILALSLDSDAVVVDPATICQIRLFSVLLMSPNYLVGPVQADLELNSLLLVVTRLIGLTVEYFWISTLGEWLRRKNRTRQINGRKSDHVQLAKNAVMCLTVRAKSRARPFLLGGRFLCAFCFGNIQTANFEGPLCILQLNFIPRHQISSNSILIRR